MSRPVPIVIPGSSRLGMNRKSSEVDLNLLGLIKAYQALFPPKDKQAADMAASTESILERLSPSPQQASIAPISTAQSSPLSFQPPTQVAGDQAVDQASPSIYQSLSGIFNQGQEQTMPPNAPPSIPQEKQPGSLPFEAISAINMPQPVINRQWQGYANNTLVQKEAAQALGKMLEGPKEPPSNDFNIFMSGYKADNPKATNSEISKAYGDELIRRNSARAVEFAKTRGITVLDPSGKAVPMSWFEINEMAKQGKRPEAAAYSPVLKTVMSQATQAGGATTANINDAYRTYHDLAPTMKELRKRVANNNIFPSGGFKKIEQLDQWMQEQASNPDVADMLTSIGMMSESLSRALGSTQGGQFMLEYANKLLDKNYAPAAFDRVVDRHEETLRTKLQHRQDFGKEAMPPEPKGANIFGNKPAPSGGKSRYSKYGITE